jgi:hypothetical protein
MKKIAILMLILLVSMLGVSMVASAGGNADCAGPVTVGPCDYDADGDGENDTTCATAYVSLDNDPPGIICL